MTIERRNILGGYDRLEVLSLLYYSAGRGRAGIMIWLFMILFTFVFPAAKAEPAAVLTEKKPVSAGVELLKYHSVPAGGSTVIYVLKVDLTNPYVRVNTMVGSDGTLEKNQKVTEMASRTGAVAAVNGDFFQMNESGRPIGLTYSDGNLITSPALRSDMYGFGITGGKSPVIDIFTFNGRVIAPGGNSFALSGINKPNYLVAGGVYADVNSLKMYTSAWGKTSRGKLASLDRVVEMVVSGGRVTELRSNQPGVQIPGDGYVLSGHGPAAAFLTDNFAVGDQVQVEYNVGPVSGLFAAVGGQALLVNQGRIPNYFTQEIKGSVARTAAAFTSDGGTLYLVTVEKSETSHGMTQGELAQFLISLGVDRAVNLDGGGSSTLVARPLGEDRAILINKPQQGSLRPVPSAIGVFSTAPPGDLAGLVLSGPDKVLVGMPVSFSAKGYDEYYNPYRVDPSGLTWSIKSGHGSVNGDVITFEAGGTATLAASFRGIEQSIQTRVMGDEDIKQLVVEPGSIKIIPGGSVDIKVKVLCKDGTTFDIGPEYLDITVDQGIGTVLGGRFTAGNAVAAGNLKVAFRENTITVPVAVSTEDQAVGRILPGLPLQLKLGSAFSVDFEAGALSEPATVSVKHGGELAGPVPERYQSLSAVTLATDSGSPALDKPARVLWKINREDITGKPVLLLWCDDSWQEQASAYDPADGVVSGDLNSLGPLVLALDTEGMQLFTDMKDHWAGRDVSILAARGIVSGFPGNLFIPQGKVTRAQFVTMLTKAMGWEPFDGGKMFADNTLIPGWAREYVAAAALRGVVSGYEDGTFKPSRTVTRSEMASMISRALDLPAVDVNVTQVFKDKNKIAGWALEPVAKAVAAGILKGDNNGRFNPAGQASRAESAAVIARILEYSEK